MRCRKVKKLETAFIVGEVVDTVVVCVVGNVGKHRDAKDDWRVTWTVKITEPPV